ncbi:MAG: autotransporter domain-containing protein [Mesorhizobium sp.]|uniref:autotransporter domain-containing protein n=1 Tax=Mesorhizobium sp. TaxID=1871066 RepID=UPI000FE851BD|nr:autotransporter serine protease [Mesorhizobium sp.]RWM07497.1 MAG: autotransporter domain-containing protein [Mesorhizobium sp.]
MPTRFRTIKLFLATTALFAPNLSLAQESVASPAPVADAEYSRNWGLSMINALPAYLKGYTGKGVVVAIVDTGLDINHPEFVARISKALHNFGTDKRLADVSHSVDKDGVPDGHGTHVAGIIGAARDGTGMQGVAYESTVLPLRAVDIGDPDDPEMDPTNEAIEYAIGAGAGVLNGSYGPGLLLGRYLKDENGQLKLDGKGYAIDNKNYEILDYQAIYDDPSNLVDTYNTLKKAAKADIVLVFAAGNDASTDDQPGAASAIPSGIGTLPLITPENTKDGNLYKFIDTNDQTNKGFDFNNPNTYKIVSGSDVSKLDFSDLAGSLITVVAVGKDGKIASYSNRCGATAEWCLAAPGGDINADPDNPIDENGIYSTWPQGDRANKNNPYKYEEGTSMATPHVAGAAAVIRSAFPYMNARQTIETLLTTTTTKGFEDEQVFGQGLLNLGVAIEGPGEFRYAGVFDVDTKGYSSIWSNSISGAGDLTKRGEGALILSGENSYSGPTKVLGGILAVDGRIVSKVGVSATGTLTGIGAVGSLTVGAGGTVAPGSVLDPSKGVAVLTVNGDFVQQAGSTYLAGIAPSKASDLIDVAGSAAINKGASVNLVREGAGHFSVDTRYTLLTAAGGVIGTYGGLTGGLFTDSPFVDFELAYDPTNVYLDVDRNSVTFADVGNTFNQRSVGAAAEALGSGNTIHDNILFLTGQGSRNAFDQLSGEIHASVHSAFVEDSHFVRDAAGDRIRAAFAGVGASTVPVMAYGPEGPELAPATSENFAVWGSGFGAWGHLDGDGNAARLDRSTGGFIAGGDAAIGESWRLGLLAGYSHTSIHVDDRASSGSGNNYHLGIYAGTQRGPHSFRSGLAYTWNRIETGRSVAFPGFSDSLSADYHAGTFQAFGELGSRLDTASVSFEPYANLAYVNFNADGFTEHGGAAALSGKDRSSDTTFTTIGLRASTAFPLGSVNTTARGGIGWRHAFGDVVPETALAFTGGSSFAVEGTPIAKNAAVFEAGIDVKLTDKATIGLTYKGQLASDAQEHGFNAKLSVRF